MTAAAAAAADDILGVVAMLLFSYHCCCDGCLLLLVYTSTLQACGSSPAFKESLVKWMALEPVLRQLYPLVFVCVVW